MIRSNGSSSSGSRVLRSQSSISQHGEDQQEDAIPIGSLHRDPPIVRTGPIKFACTVLCLVPLALFSISEQRIAIKEVQEFRTNRATEIQWKNPDVSSVSVDFADSATRSKPRDDSGTTTSRRVAMDNMYAQDDTISYDDLESNTVKSDYACVVVAVALIDTKEWIVSTHSTDNLQGSGPLSPIKSTFVLDIEAPWRAAMRIAQQVLGTTVETFFGSTQLFVKDEEGVPTGEVPRNLNAQLVPLGRYNYSDDKRVGFTYHYLFTTKKRAVRKIQTTAELGNQTLGEEASLLLMPKLDIQYALLSGKFQDMMDAATMSLALQHFDLHVKRGRIEGHV